MAEQKAGNISNVVTLKESNSNINSIVSNKIDDNQSRFNEEELELWMHSLRENMAKRLYKRTLLEISSKLGQKMMLLPNGWKLRTLKLRALLKVNENKMLKYDVNQSDNPLHKFENRKILQNFRAVEDELSNFMSDFKSSKFNVNKNLFLLEEILIIYYDFIYLNALYNKRLNKPLDCIGYLALVVNLYKETVPYVKKPCVLNKAVRVFLLLSFMLIVSGEYAKVLPFLEQAMNICFREFIFRLPDAGDGIHLEELPQKNSSKSGYSKTLIEGLKKNSELCKLRKIAIHIIVIFFYRGVCFEELGKIKKAVESYKECCWFAGKFFAVINANLCNFVDALKSKAVFLSRTVSRISAIFREINAKRSNSLTKLRRADTNSTERSAALRAYTPDHHKKYGRTLKKIKNLSIKEIDTVNKFEVKRCMLEKKVFRDRNMYMSNLKLLNAYLRDDFREILNSMGVIKLYDLDYKTREKIQKLFYRMHFEESLRYLEERKKKLRIKQQAKEAFINNNNFQNYIENSKKNCDQSANLSHTLKGNKVNVSAHILNKSQNVRNNDSNTIDSHISPHTTKQVSKATCKKRKIDFKHSHDTSQHYKITRTKELFNKKYLQKREYVKAIANREYSFHKSLLRLKNTPRYDVPEHNTFVQKEAAKDQFCVIQSVVSLRQSEMKDNYSDEEMKQIKIEDKLESIVIKSLDRKSIIKYHEQRKNRAKKRLQNSAEFSANYFLQNQKILEKLDQKIRKISQVEKCRYEEDLKYKRQQMLRRNRSQNYFGLNLSSRSANKCKRYVPYIFPKKK